MMCFTVEGGWCVKFACTWCNRAYLVGHLSALVTQRQTVSVSM